LDKTRTRWRKDQLGPHPELKKLPAQKQRKAGKKLLTAKQRARITRKAIKKYWAGKKLATVTQTPALNFCPACGTDVSAITPKNFCPGCGLNLRTIKFVNP
jgi:rubrerythrin